MASVQALLLVKGVRTHRKGHKDESRKVPTLGPLVEGDHPTQQWPRQRPVGHRHPVATVTVPGCPHRLADCH